MRRHPVALALAVPPLLLAALSVASFVAAVADVHPLWRDLHQNLGEAAAGRDHGEVGRLLEAGADPNATYELRPGWVSVNAVRVTPLEAAVLQNDENLAELLLTLGAAPTPEVWHRLRCVERGEAVADILAKHHAPPRDAACGDVTPLW